MWTKVFLQQSRKLVDCFIFMSLGSECCLLKLKSCVIERLLKIRNKLYATQQKLEFFRRTLNKKHENDILAKNIKNNS